MLRPRRYPATTSIAIADSAPSRTETKIVIRLCSPREQARASGLARVADDYDFAIQTNLAIEETVFLTGD